MLSLIKYLAKSTKQIPVWSGSKRKEQEQNHNKLKTIILSCIASHHEMIEIAQVCTVYTECSLLSAGKPLAWFIFRGLHEVLMLRLALTEHEN